MESSTVWKYDTFDINKKCEKVTVREDLEELVVVHSHLSCKLQSVCNVILLCILLCVVGVRCFLISDAR